MLIFMYVTYLLIMICMVAVQQPLMWNVVRRLIDAFKIRGTPITHPKTGNKK